MARAEARVPPPAQKQRREVGQFKRKVDKKESTAIHNQAVARRQEVPIRKFVLVSIIVAASCTLLYLYLGWVVAEDDDETPESQ